MSDATTLVRHPSEAMKDFNKRLRERCKETPVTDFDLVVVDGQVAVTLLAEEEPATEEDVAEAKADDPESTLTVGDPLPVSTPLMVQVSLLDARTDQAAKHSQQRVDTLFQRGEGLIEQAKTVVGEISEWVPNLSLAKQRPDGSIDLDKHGNPQLPDGKPVPFTLARRQIVYIGIASEAPEPGDEQAESGEAP